MTTKKLEKLTPEQEAQLSVYRDKWLKIGLSTQTAPYDDAAKARIEELLVQVYAVAGLPPPTKFVYLPSPMAGARAAAELKKASDE